jgi:hypothetical protein
MDVERVRFCMCVDRANFGCKPMYGMIGDDIFLFNDTFDFGRPYLSHLVTKLNNLNYNRCAHKMRTIHLQTRDPTDSK